MAEETRGWVPPSFRMAGGDALAAWHRGECYAECQRILDQQNQRPPARACESEQGSETR